MNTKVIQVKKWDVPQNKMNEYKEAFDMFDRDGNGTISANEIGKILKNFGNPMSKQEILKMISEIDQDQSGDWDFEEFVTMMQKQNVEEGNKNNTEDKEEDEILKAFKSFDKDNNGYLTVSEFRYIWTQKGEKFTNEEVEEIFKECNWNKDGKIDYKEFIEFWKSQ